MNRVIKMVEAKGLEAHVVRGEEMTIIGCIGDTVRIDPRLFEVDKSVDKVMHVQEPYKLANRAFHRRTPLWMYPVSRWEAETWR